MPQPVSVFWAIVWLCICGTHKLVDRAIPYGIAVLHGRVNLPLVKNKL
ncbi:hypothetical protein QUB08_07395 [Microcoleus sp. BR0-C5]